MPETETHPPESQAAPQPEPAKGAPEGAPGATEPSAPAAKSADLERVERWDRWSSRLLFLGGLIALAIGAMVTTGHRLPVSLLLGWIAAFMAVKVGLLFLAARAKWRAWPALALETAAFGAVGYIVLKGLPLALDASRSLGLVVLSAACLIGAGMLRRRAA